MGIQVIAQRRALDQDSTSTTIKQNENKKQEQQQPSNKKPRQEEMEIPSKRIEDSRRVREGKKDNAL